jgi:uncharacterized protein YndB with AHSA1/START domain
MPGAEPRRGRPPAGGQDVIVREIFIEASPEVVFEFFVDAEKITRWLAAEATLDPRPGGACKQVHVAECDGRTGMFHLDGEFVEVEPPNRVVFTWGFTEPEVGVPPGSSTVEVTLEARDGGTHVRLTHRGLPPSELGNHAGGWTAMLERLAEVATERTSTMDTIYHEVWINADRSTVFDAISTQKGLDSWWGKVSEFEPRVGEIIEFDHGLGAPLRMRITDFVPDKRFGWECVSKFANPANPGSEWLGTRFTFELRDGGKIGFDKIDASLGDSVTIVEFRHSRWPETARWIGFCNYAWGVTLLSMAQRCEANETAG